VLAGYFDEPPQPGGVPLSREEAIYYSREGLALRQEMVWNGRKLWDRQYVDGNGGNLSCRIGEDLVLCTPSMVSKADLSISDLCLVDLDGKEMLGRFRKTSELLLHLEIYKANPNARAVVHCHPPHATAYAIAGIVPPEDVVPEQEVFVGPVALAPYDTPGTQAFAKTILPFVNSHNSILLANHGVVCWADTVTHAEWFVEVLDTYCRTLLLAYQLRAPIQRISKDKISDLLRLKQRLGLPDARLDENGAKGSYEFPKPMTPEFVSDPPGGIELLAREIAQAVTAHLVGNGNQPSRGR
jgi:L-fuculose-phosphate aldolase